MARREMTVERFSDIKRLIGLGRSDRQIAMALKVRRMKVAEIRRGEAVDPALAKVFKAPLWAVEVDWGSVQEELGYKHPLKFIWEEKAQSKTSYPNFWKCFYKKFPHLRKALSVPREFNPGERADAVKDRVRHSALTFHLTGETYRAVKAKKLDREGK